MRTRLRWRWWLTALVSIAAGLVSGPAGAQRFIPDDLLALPALISVSGTALGSGFFIGSAKATYLITARHVVYDAGGALLPSVRVTAFAVESNDPTKFVIDVNLAALFRDDRLARDTARDVVVVQVGLVFDHPTDKSLQRIEWQPGVNSVSMPARGYLSAPMEKLRPFEEVLVSNQIVLFGYPATVGLPQIGKQFDYDRPLLRAGIVAGKYKAQRTIILDASVHGGNSGGPVLQVEQDGRGRHFSIIGVVTQWIPAVLQGTNTVAHSGYSVAASVDPIKTLIVELEK